MLNIFFSGRGVDPPLMSAKNLSFLEIYKWTDMIRFDRLKYSVKILNNKIYWGYDVNWATFYLRTNISNPNYCTVMLFTNPRSFTNLQLSFANPRGSRVIWFGEGGNITFRSAGLFE